MIIRSTIISYLQGEQFSAKIQMELAESENKVLRKTDLIKRLIYNKKIIHLGCCDHIPLIDKKLANDNWIHKKIENNSYQCLGIDINHEAIEFVRKKGFNNIIYGDITNDKIIDEIVEEKWDFMFMGEILEHIDNPVEFLKKIRKNYQDYIEKIIITVPNAFAINNYKFANRNIESINSDHRYWFTPYTLAKIGTVAGYQIDSFYFTDDINERISLIKKLKIIPYLKRKHKIRLLKNKPSLRKTLVMIMSL